MPHLSPLIWTLLFFSVWTILYFFTLSFEFLNPNKN